MFEDHSMLLTKLLRRLEEQLPGPSTQAMLSPRPRTGWTPGVLPGGCRQAAALVLIYPINGQSSLLLTQRRHDLPDHGGQVSLPGGELEADETNTQGALREAKEEVGISREHVIVVGNLSPLHIPVSRFILHPIVGHAVQRPLLKPSNDEVSRILEPSIASLASPNNWSCKRSERRGNPIEVPFFKVGNLEVWGATAMVLAELLALLDVFIDPWTTRTERSGE